MTHQAPSATSSTIPKSKWNDEYDEDDYVQFGGEKDDFMMRFVDSTCQGIMPSDEGPCQGILPACEASLDQQLDLFTHCRQPLSLLSFFQEHKSQEGVVGVEVLPAGVYVVPTFCEYCGAPNLSECSPQCQRPALYFQKKRPPFCQPDKDKWDPVTDHAIEPPARVVSTEEAASERAQSPSSASGSWVPHFLQYPRQPTPSPPPPH